jgi:hypothetical protein
MAPGQPPRHAPSAEAAWPGTGCVQPAPVGSPSATLVGDFAAVQNGTVRGIATAFGAVKRFPIRGDC